MRNKPNALFIFWFMAFSVIATSSEGQQVADYQSWRPRLLQTSNPPEVKPMARQTFRLESSPFGVEVRLYLNDSKRTVEGELLFVDEDSITILTPYENTMTFQLEELRMVKGRFGRIAPRTHLLQCAGVLSTVATGYVVLFAAPANLAIATAMNGKLTKSLRFKTRQPGADWRFLRAYSRHPAGWPDDQPAP